MGFKVRVKGNTNTLEKMLKKATKNDNLARFAKYGEMGVQALSEATPVDTGKTAASWGYHLSFNESGIRLSFTNSNIVNGVPIAIILDTGHATKNGGYVEGYYYIDKAIQPVFERIANEMWKELTG